MSNPEKEKELKDEIARLSESIDSLDYERKLKELKHGIIAVFLFLPWFICFVGCVISMIQREYIVGVLLFFASFYTCLFAVHRFQAFDILLEVVVVLKYILITFWLILFTVTFVCGLGILKQRYGESFGNGFILAFSLTLLSYLCFKFKGEEFQEDYRRKKKILDDEKLQIAMKETSLNHALYKIKEEFESITKEEKKSSIFKS